MNTLLALALGLVAPSVAEAGGEHVLVRADAEWFTEPREDSPAITLAEPPRTHAAPQVLPAALVAESGDFVEVELVAQSDCTSSRTRVDDRLETVHLYVKRDAIAPVLAKKFSARYPDGSRIALLPGVAVKASRRGGRVWVLDNEVELAIPTSSLASSYAPPPPWVEPAPTELFVEPGTPTRLGKSLLDIGVPPARGRKQRGTYLLSYSAPCIDVTVAIAAKHVREIASGTMYGLGGGGSGIGVLAKERWIVPKGTPLLTPTGRAVATAADDIDLGKPPSDRTACLPFEIEVEDLGTRAVQLEATPAHRRKLELCAPASAIRHEKRRPGGPS